jgi:hypothetical protein
LYRQNKKLSQSSVKKIQIRGGQGRMVEVALAATLQILFSDVQTAESLTQLSTV